MVIDHVGIVVPSLERGIQMWDRAFGYRQMTEPVFNSRQKVKVVFMQKEGSTTVKLIQPMDPASSLSALASRGGGLHHLCFKAPDLQKAMHTLKAEGAKILVPPEPGEAFEDELIAFAYFHGMLMEVIATEKKAKVISGHETQRS